MKIGNLLRKLIPARFKPVDISNFPRLVILESNNIITKEQLSVCQKGLDDLRRHGHLELIKDTAEGYIKILTKVGPKLTLDHLMVFPVLVSSFKGLYPEIKSLGGIENTFINLVNDGFSAPVILNATIANHKSFAYLNSVQ